MMGVDPGEAFYDRLRQQTYYVTKVVYIHSKMCEVYFRGFNGEPYRIATVVDYNDSHLDVQWLREHDCAVDRLMRTKTKSAAPVSLTVWERLLRDDFES